MPNLPLAAQLRIFRIMHRISRENDATVVEAGRSYGSNEEDLAELAKVIMDQASKCEPPRLVVDMTNTSYIASNFLELLIRAWKKLKSRGGVLAICGIQPFCAEVLVRDEQPHLIRARQTFEDLVRNESIPSE